MRGFIFLFGFCAACMPGTIESTGGPAPGGSDGPDAAVASGTDGASTVGTPDAATAANCKMKVTSVGSGHHNPGQDCQQGCHNHGFTLSGTLYASATSTTPVVGASITVKDAQGKTFDMVSQNDGNFYTSTAVTFPVTVSASLCPDTHAMAGSITAGNGGCNKSGCHASGAQGKIYLP
jgi:hypothetical protein